MDSLLLAAEQWARALPQQTAHGLNYGPE